MILLLILAILPTTDAARDRCDLIEVNHFYDENGKHVFDQLIFYDWRPVQSRYEVRAWRLLKSANQMPVRDWRDGEWRATWSEGELLRQVQAPTFRESWTQYDVEMVERDFLPKEKRGGAFI